MKRAGNMTASEISSQTLEQLRATFLKMTSPEWDLALMGKPDDVVNESAKTLLLVQSARLRLENAELAGIRDKLVENEKGLEEGRVQLNKSLERLDQIEGVLNAITSFVDVVARVVPLV
jgi:hypothetical protein